MPNGESVAGCGLCADPLAIALRPELEVRRLSATIAVLRCPRCSCLVLDDVTGWKGAGAVLRATEAMIADYARSRGAIEPPTRAPPPTHDPSLADRSGRSKARR